MASGMSTIRRRWSLAFLAFSAAALAALRADDPSPEAIEFFEKRIRPVLVEHCYSCHSDEIEKPKARLRVDSLEGLLRGGLSGLRWFPAIPSPAS